MAALVSTDLTAAAAVADQAFVQDVAKILKNHLGWDGMTLNPIVSAIKTGEFYNLGKVVVPNNAAATYTVNELTPTVRFTGTQAAAVAFTLPVATAALDGLQVTISSAVALATATWISTGATFDGAPTALAANTPIQLTYHHPTTSWFRSM